MHSRYKVVLTQDTLALIDSSKNRQVQIKIQRGTDLTKLYEYINEAKKLLRK